MTKRNAVKLGAAAVSLMAAILSFGAMNRLAPYRDIIEFVYDNAPDDLYGHMKEMRIREIASFAVLTRHTNAFAGVEEGRSAMVSVYECGPELVRVTPPMMKHGNFLADVSPVLRKDCAVIDEAVASILFSYTDCVGKEINIGGRIYTVVGVTAKSNAVVGIFGSLDKHTVYVYTGDYASWAPARTSLVVKCHENTAGIVLARLSVSVSGARAEINHDAKVRFVAFMARLLLLIGISRPLYRSVRSIIRWVRTDGKRPRIDNTAIGNIVMTVVLSGCLVIILSGLRFALDTRMIPASLANTDAILDKLRDWYLLVNNGQISGGLYDPVIHVYSWLTIGWAVTGLATTWKLAVKAKRLL